MGENAALLKTALYRPIRVRQLRQNASKNRPATTLLRPMKRIWPSLMRVARSKTSRQVVGLMNGNKPSMTNINAKAPSNTSPMVASGLYFFAGAA